MTPKGNVAGKQQLINQTAMSGMIFICTNCDAQFVKWTGRCLECGAWGTMSESKIQNQKSKINEKESYEPTKTVSLSDIQGKEVTRIRTNIGELDQVLGGGIVPGSLMLLSGEPGIGKSTLAMQIALAVPNTIYISGEEAVEQIKMRTDRINIETHVNTSLQIGNETNLEKIIATIHAKKPVLTIIDSIQTISSDEVGGEIGGVTQVRACTTKLLTTAKTSNTAIVLIGHVTKDGAVAGPKTLEHLVDAVLSFEGDRFHTYRILRAAKNRFGATDEVGIFEMTSGGLADVKNPSALFLEERGESIPGSVVTCLMEGMRPLLVEIQALVNKTSFGYPVRKTSGFDLNRLHVLVAVLQKRAGVNLGQYDIHVNVVGGMSADEPAADLAVCFAIASSFKDKTLGKDLVVFGEVGLGGEVRSVRATDKRLRECETLGMKRVIVAKQKKTPILAQGLQLISVQNIQELIRQTE